MRSFKVIRDPEAFQLLADETRRRIIYLLRVKEMTVAQIAEELKLTPQAIYHHIRKLKDADMVEVAREERVDHFIETYYQATAEMFNLAHGEAGSAKVMEQEVREALEALVADLGTLEAFAGRLAEGPSITLEALATRDDLSRRLGHVFVYAYLDYSVDTGDQAAVARFGRAQSVYGQAAAASSFVFRKRNQGKRKLLRGCGARRRRPGPRTWGPSGGARAAGLQRKAWASAFRRRVAGPDRAADGGPVSSSRAGGPPAGACSISAEGGRSLTAPSSDTGPTIRRIDHPGGAAVTGSREAEELLLIEEADAWFEYLEAIRGQTAIDYAEVEPWAWARLNQRLRAIRTRRAKLRPPPA